MISILSVPVTFYRRRKENNYESDMENLWFSPGCRSHGTQLCRLWCQQRSPEGRKPVRACDFQGTQIDTKGMLAKAKDGTFTGQSKPNDRGGYTELTITIENHKITAAKFVGFNKDGSIKGEDYGKTNGKIENKVYYNKAQAALQANTSYAEALLQKQEVNKVDGISGATDSYILFFDAAQKALEAAERG